MYEYQAVESKGTRDHQVDLPALRGVLEQMSSAGWRLVSTLPDLGAGSVHRVITIWEREKQ